MQKERSGTSEAHEDNSYTSWSAPSISLPKGGGAIRGIDEQFSVNPVNGSSGVSISLPFSPSRNGFMPSAGLSYSSGGGNGIFGLGWQGDVEAVCRRTDKRLPLYQDRDESDIFGFTGGEELTPVYQEMSGEWVRKQHMEGTVRVSSYRPRTESGFSRIEKLEEMNGGVYWRMTTGSNIVSIYGKSAKARVSDPADPSKVFRWLLEFCYDDKGNCCRYEYKQEDDRNVPTLLHEQGRLEDIALFTNLYLKRVKYCNAVHFNRDQIDLVNWDAYMAGIDYLLEMVFDYGEHDTGDPQPDDDLGWDCRADAFSSCKSGFEIRTYRLCNRVLMFHRFAELGSTPCLVRSLDFVYERHPAFSFLQSATVKGYIRKPDGGYSMKAMPPVTYAYEPLGWSTDIRTLSADVMADLPVGIDEEQYRWVDLYKEGLPGILTEQEGGWFYKDNFGEGQFGGMRQVASRPSLIGLNKGELQLQDIAGGGQQFVVSRGLKGYYELDSDQEWMSFRHFDQVVNVDLRDPNLRLLDLNGDGMADILITNDEVFTWHVSKGRAGFETYRQVQKMLDEKKGPALVFADVTESIMLADMSGDGLTDIVRVRYDAICYWPNLGYGRFGPMVNMSDAPVLATEDQFDPRRVVFADIDGSGVASMVYTGRDRVVVYFNQAGNSWSQGKVVAGVDPLVKLQVVDLLGSGTACIVWSSGFPRDRETALRYIDLMGGKKPYVMKGYANNMGAEVEFSYRSSTYFYIQDKRAGQPWVTKLPFAVQCIDKVTAIDHVRNTRYANVYSYHHGYYDPVEREFRGFGRVDQIDSDQIDAFSEPPVLKKTWFHTGVFPGKEKVFSVYAGEYFGNGAEKELDAIVLPDGLSDDEWREACRACRGSVLRSEIYTLDGSEKQGVPYSTTSNAYTVRMLQPRGQLSPAVFLVLPAEALTYDYERNVTDPRISHGIPVTFDDYGNTIESAMINYGRRVADPELTTDEQAAQGRTYIVYTKKTFTNVIDTLLNYRLPMGSEMKAWELTGAAPAQVYFSGIGVLTAFGQSEEIGFEIAASGMKMQKRVLQQTKTLMWKDDMTGPLPLGVMEPLGLTYQSYKLSMTASLRAYIYGDKVDDALLLDEGKYAHFDDGNYWVCSTLPRIDAKHFYQLTQELDPFGFGVKVEYDDVYRLFVRRTTDQLGNESSVLGFDYRTLQPWMCMDLNDNRTAIRTDELGMMVSSFVLGKEGRQEGDLMDFSSANVSETDRPSGQIDYNLTNFMATGQPNFSVSTMRERYYYDDSGTGSEPVFRKSYNYFDGSGVTIMKKAQADPGLAWQLQPDGSYREIDTSPALRWIGNGRTIVNGKGKPVKQYDTYYSATPAFEDAAALVELGISSIITYDAGGRAVRTDMPDGTFTSTVFDNWQQLLYDRNDNVIGSQWYQERTAPGASAQDAAAAAKSAVHADTPAMAYIDSLGRTWLAVSDSGPDGKYKSTSVVDISGHLLGMKDAMGHLLVEYKYDMLGVQLYHNAMDSGEQWLVNDVMGKALRNWDNKGNILRYETDALHRPVRLYLANSRGQEINTEYAIYGESLPDAKDKNLRGSIYKHFDSAGLAVNIATDMAGNPLQTQLQYFKDFTSDPDWKIMTEADLDAETFSTITAFDALRRAIRIALPGGNVMRPVYNEMGALSRVYVSIKGLPETIYVKEIKHNALGQRTSITYANGAVTSYVYDTRTRRLTSITTSSGNKILQQLQYVYDAIGNVSFVKDAAQPDVFFDNAVVRAENDYVYDAIYRLIQASGREQVGQNTLSEVSGNSDLGNYPFITGANADDMNAMRNYIQKYRYDAAGNITSLQHIAGTGSFTRSYKYGSDNNRLLETVIGDKLTKYEYDLHGNMISLPQLVSLDWNFREDLRKVDLGGGGKAYYIYGATGNRSKKVIVRLDGSREERCYLGNFELFRKYDSAGKLREETETLHIMDDQRRMAMVETKTIDAAIQKAEGTWAPLTRYQHGSLLSSSALELDDAGATISYEEYHPYGTTSTAFFSKEIKVSAKRYRYLGLERDEETGMSHHGARYYLPWLGRWLSPDPSYYKDSFNVYQYARCNPVTLMDSSGMDSSLSPEEKMVLLEVAGTVVYKAHKYQGGAAFTDPLESWIFNWFVQLGEYAMSDCNKKLDKMVLFDIGMKMVADHYGVGRYFYDNIILGDRVAEQRAQAVVSLRWEGKLTENGFFAGYVAESKAQFDENTRQRANNINQLPRYIGDLIGSMGLDGAAEARDANASLGLHEFRENDPRNVEIRPQAPAEATGGTAEPAAPKLPSIEEAQVGEHVLFADAGNDPAGQKAFAEKTGARILNKLAPGALKGVKYLAILVHSDGIHFFFDGETLTASQLATKLKDAGFEGGKITLISCFTGSANGGLTSLGKSLYMILNSRGLETSVMSSNNYAGLATSGPHKGSALVHKGKVNIDAPQLAEDWHDPGIGWSVFLAPPK